MEHVFLLFIVFYKDGLHILIEDLSQ